MNPTAITGSVQPVAQSQQFYTIKEAAAILRVGEDTLRRMMKRGQIPFTQITPHTRRISQKTLDQVAQGGY